MVVSCWFLVAGLSPTGRVGLAPPGLLFEAMPALVPFLLSQNVKNRINSQEWEVNTVQLLAAGG